MQIVEVVGLQQVGGSAGSAVILLKSMTASKRWLERIQSFS